MDILTNKRYEVFDYNSRYTHVPYFYNTVDERDIYGVGSNMIKDIEWTAHTVRPGDTLDSLALTYYNNPTFWWVLAYFNDIQDAFVDLTGTYKIIKIPVISKIEFGAER